MTPELNLAAFSSLSTDLVRRIFDILPHQRHREDLRRLLSAWASSNGHNAANLHLPTMINLLWDDALYSEPFINSFGALLKKDLPLITPEHYKWLYLLISQGMRSCDRHIRSWLVSFVVRAVESIEYLQNVRESLDCIREIVRVLTRDSAPPSKDLIDLRILMIQKGKAEPSLLEWSKLIKPIEEVKPKFYDLDSDQPVRKLPDVFRTSLEAKEARIRRELAASEVKGMPLLVEKLKAVTNRASETRSNTLKTKAGFQSLSERIGVGSRETHQLHPTRPPVLPVVASGPPPPMFPSSKSRTKISLADDGPGLPISSSVAPTKSTTTLDALDELHRFVLTLDWSTAQGIFDHHLANSTSSSPRTFSSPEEYLRYFSPLINVELAAGLAQAAEAGGFTSCRVKISSVGRRGNDWCLVGLKSKAGEDKADQNKPGQPVALNPLDRNLPIVPGDVVALVPLSRDEEDCRDEDGGSNGPSFLQHPSRCLIGIVFKPASSSGGSLALKSLTAAPNCRFGYSAAEFPPESEWKAVVISSLNTAEREWSALHWFCREGKMMLKQILSPSVTPSNPHSGRGEISDSFLNPSQVAAVQQATSMTKQVTLIQGPPGTGKTKAIVSIISALLAKPRTFPILVAAPSNAAVDEIALRLLPKTKIVRVGRASKINEALIPYMLEEIVRGSLSNVEGQKHEEYKARKEEIYAEIASLNQKLKDGSVTHTQYQVEKRMHVESISKLKTTQSESLASSKDSAYTKILLGSQVILGTLSSFGSEVVTNSLPHGRADVCIIDEAAQAVEVSTLIPLVLGVRKLVLVGDPQQLPATLIARQPCYERSLFERLMQAGIQVSLLDEQYRMHPAISKFPSEYFYQGRLKDAASLEDRGETIWGSAFEAPMAWLDLTASGEIKFGNSFANVAEAQLVKKLSIALLRHCQSGNASLSKGVGIITFYKQQARMIKQQLGDSILSSGLFEIDTVDAFQGREKDVIILSCVRSNSSTIGFASDVRRLNVALTRAKFALWIVGDKKCMSRGADVWSSLAERCVTVVASGLSDCDIDRRFQLAKKRPRED